LVPASRDVSHRQLSFDELQFDFEAQDDVQVVGDLVGFDTDERGRDSVDCPSDLRGRQFFEFWKVPANDRVPVLPKSRAAANMIFPEARLGFVDAEGSGAAQGGAVVFGGKPLLVKTVAGFVENAKEGLRKILLVVARGQA